jgi:ribosome biogenesis GTPase
MSKRRITKQQSMRIEKKHQQFRQQFDATMHDGLVITRHGRHAKIEDQHGNHMLCSIRPDIDSLVAGDQVVWSKINPQQGVVISRYPRKTILGRPDKQGIVKAIAANISQIIIVVAPKPQISWLLLDCYLVMAEHLNMQACIILNKTDLGTDKLSQELQLYVRLGYPLILTSYLDNNNHALQQICAQNTSVFVGQSGVGKSSLITRILPKETARIQTAEISSSSELGCHTTRNSCLYHLPSGGAIVDSPGVRELGLWHMPATDIIQGYLEFRPFFSQCKFRNCTHQHTPGCALLNALKNNLISHKRYENYVKICEQFAKF